MGKFIRFKTMSDDAWFYCNSGNVLNTLRVVFVSECNNENEDPSGAWQRFSDEAKNNRITAIAVALTDISLDEVEFENREACRLQDDIMNIYDLLMAMHEHPEARLAHLMSRYADGITSLDSDSDLGEHITEELVLKTFAHFITEDILDIEAELYAHTDDTEEKLSKPDSANCEHKSMSKSICFKDTKYGAWFWADRSCVADSLRVIFGNELLGGMAPMESWVQMDPVAKTRRLASIRMALRGIAINEVEFSHPNVCNACDGITNVLNLFRFMDKHPDAILTRVGWVWGIEHGLAAEDIRVRIDAETLLKNLAPFIAEDILDIEAELYSHMNDDTEEKLAKLDTSIARCERVAGSDDKVVCAAKKARKRIADEMSPLIRRANQLKICIRPSGILSGRSRILKAVRCEEVLHMEIKWSVGDICKMNTYARRDITVQIRTYMIIGTDVIYIVEETLAPFEKHICFENDLHEVGRN